MGRLNCAIHEIRSFCPEVRFSLDDFPNMHNSVRTLHTIDFMDVVKIDGDWIKLKIEKCKEEYGEDGYLEAFREDLRNMIELIRTSHNNCEIVVEKIENEDIRAIFE